MKSHGTQVSICYMGNITNDDLVAEVKNRLNNIKIDSITSSGVLENLIKDNIYNIYPETIATERPDKASNLILSRQSSYFNKWISFCSNCTSFFGRFFCFNRRLILKPYFF